MKKILGIFTILCLWTGLFCAIPAVSNAQTRSNVCYWEDHFIIHPYNPASGKVWNTNIGCTSNNPKDVHAYIRLEVFVPKEGDRYLNGNTVSGQGSSTSNYSYVSAGNGPTEINSWECWSITNGGSGCSRA